jgi:hypothetical protein
MTRIPQTDDDLKKHLAEQLGFLRRSADSYDAGYVDEAKRLAVTIRVLVHNTNNSRSLLEQLHETDKLFWDTAVPDEPGNLIPHGALVQMATGPRGATYLPYLDDLPPSSHVPTGVRFDEWWNAAIFRNAGGQTLSRRDLVLAVANQDGGAHVDPNLNDAYSRLSRGEGMGWVFRSPREQFVVRPAELAAVRQIAHEVIKTFEPTYEAHPTVPADMPVLLAGSAFRPQTPEEIQEHGRTDRAPQRQPSFSGPKPKIGRNRPCPCGSGKKFKKCHGAT